MANKFLSQVLIHPVFRNALSLFTVQIARYILPLVTIPYLARVLGPEAWGVVIFAQASAQWLVLVLEYGFSLSATREIAHYQDNQEQITEIVANVVGALGLLLLGSGLLVLFMRWSIPAFEQHPDYLVWAWVIAIGQGLSPLWYFQGIERMYLPAMVDLGVRLISTLGTFLWIKNPNEGWKVLSLQAIPGLLASALMVVWMYRDIPCRLPRFASALATLRTGWSMFLFRSSVSLYTTANTFILGLLVPSSTVAFYGEGQRISKAVGGLLSPISQAMFPRISYLLVHDSQRAAKLASISMIVMGLGSLGLAAILAIAAPLIVHTLLGSNFEPTIPLLRILVLLIPFMTLNFVLGIQWMVPLGLDRACNAIIMMTGLINVVMAIFFTQSFGAIGMAWAVVLSELFSVVGMSVVLWRKGLHFHQISKLRKTKGF